MYSVTNEREYCTQKKKNEEEEENIHKIEQKQSTIRDRTGENTGMIKENKTTSFDNLCEHISYMHIHIIILINQPLPSEKPYDLTIHAY